MHTLPGIDGVTGTAVPSVPTPVAAIKCRASTVIEGVPERETDIVQVPAKESYETAAMHAEVKT